MPEFRYTARNSSGAEVTDVLTAPNRITAGQILREQGLLPTSIKEKKKKILNWDAIRSSIGRVSLLEKLTFIKNLAVTIRAGLPISKALKVVSEQLPNLYFRKILADIAHNVESGQTLSESMNKYPKVFSSIFVNMVKAGEQSGQLEQNLDYLARQVNRDYYLIKKTKGALTYPSVVLVALVLIGYIMFVFVLPKLTETFKQFNVDLPILTQIIIGSVDLVSQYAVLIAIVALGVATGLWFWARTEVGKTTVHRLILMIPVIGNVAKKINLARFTLVFSGLLRSGLPIVEALRVSGDTVSNIHYQRAIHEASEKVKIGVALDAAFGKYPKLFTPMVVQMVKVGEESGTMENTLAEVANFYETDIDDSIKNLSSIIEPVLVIVIGAVVAVLAVGLILPIYNLSSTI